MKNSVAIFWLRYIDEIFMVWTEGPNNLEIFIDYNNMLLTIKFTSSYSAANLTFLDVNVTGQWRDTN